MSTAQEQTLGRGRWVGGEGGRRGLECLSRARGKHKCSLSPPRPGDLEGLPVDSDRGHSSRTFPPTVPGPPQGSSLPPHKMPRKQRDAPPGASLAKQVCCPGSLEGPGLGLAQASASPRGRSRHSGKERRASTASSVSMQGSVLGLILSPRIFGGTARPGGMLCSAQDGVLLERVLETRFASQCSVLCPRRQKATFCGPQSSVCRGLQGALTAERRPQASSLQPGL